MVVPGCVGKRDDGPGWTVQRGANDATESLRTMSENSRYRPQRRTEQPGAGRRSWRLPLMHRFQISAVAIVLTAGTVRAASPTRPADPLENERCLNCHGQRRIATIPREERDSMVSPPPSPTGWENPESLYFDQGVFDKSVHRGLACGDCHPGPGDLPHSARLPAPTCEACHETQADLYLRGVHAEKLAEGAKDVPQCWTCHGGHDVLPPTERESQTYPLNVLAICTGCHEQHGQSPNGQQAGSQLVQSYVGSVHGSALDRGGLVVAATCPDCHQAHDIRRSDDAQSSVHRAQVPQTCGRCHVGVVEVYEKSIHGEKLAAGHPKAPVCTDCHTAHDITRAATPTFMLDIVTECGECHNEPEVAGERRRSFYETYRQSYHGQVTALGSTRAARCSDCHGAHDIRPIAHRASRLHGERRLQTCRSCHAGVDAKFMSFAAHADYTDGERYPVLHAVWLYFIIVMSGAFGFFGLHSVLWFVRSAIERARRGPLPRFPASSTAIQRFSRADRINHFFVIISFFGLTLTGLPLRFSDHEWARGLAALLGGGNAAGVLHRVFAIMLGCNFVAHVAVLVKRRQRHASLRSWLFGPNTMIPRLKDVKDCLGMFRWFFRGGAKPAFDRWTYWEKFDYAGEVFGSLIIGGSGLLLWFPVFFSAVVPGWMFNVAMIIHGYEALLALGFIFTIHFFNAHLRLEKFPVDDVIFTGRLPEEEFKHERGIEYLRLCARDELEALRVPAAPKWQRKAAVVIGVVSMTIGMTLVTLIILAGLGAI